VVSLLVVTMSRIGAAGSHSAATKAGGSAMCRWSLALLSTIRAGASPGARGMETAPPPAPSRTTQLPPFPSRLAGWSPQSGSHRARRYVNQGAELIAELCPMAGHGSYLRRLYRRHSGNRQCCCGARKVFMSFLAVWAFARCLAFIEVIAQHAVVEPMYRCTLQLKHSSADESIRTYIRCRYSQFKRHIGSEVAGFS
jgi:hypothetical protein